MENKEFVIRINNLNKVYRLYRKPIDRLKEAIRIFGSDLHEDFYALRGINCKIHKGDSVGIIGTNGSGKSTFLKILTGVLNATSGYVDINGKISALLELGAGFNMEYTGLENVYLNGTILGYSKEEMDKKLDTILKFADIGDFIYQPVKNYSSGMFVRLAFSVAINVNPEILIVDEALSVGDARFQQKCYRAMEGLMKDRTVILVSHDSDVIAKYCNRVLWIEKGKLMFDGPTKEGLKEYQSYLLKNMDKEDTEKELDSMAGSSNKIYSIAPVVSSVQKAGTLDAEIVKCGLLDMDGRIVDELKRNLEYQFVMDVSFKKPVLNCIVGFSVRNHIGANVFAINSYIKGIKVDTKNGKCQYQMRFKVPPLNAGEYTISPAIAQGTMLSHAQLCWLQDAIVFHVPREEYELPGYIYMDKENYSITMIDIRE